MNNLSGSSRAAGGPIRLDEAAAELLRRRSARKGLLHFTNFTFPQYQADPVHELIAATLDQVVAGEIKRLMIFAPPQNGKSELASVRLPAYWLGRRPDDPVIISSYGAELAESKSGQVRQIVESEEYARLFPGISTQRDSRAVNRWLIGGRRGGLLAVGVGGPVTGHGTLLGIIDDPHENWEQAQSQTMRDKVWNWYTKTFRTRIRSGGAVVLIMTRWHEDDLAGRLLQSQGKRWTVLRLPAVAETQEERDKACERMHLPQGQADPLGREPGEPLAPRLFSGADLKELEIDVGPQGWNAEYQARPTAPEGDRIKRAWFKIVDAVPEGAKWVRYWDNGGTEGGGCPSAGVKMGCVGKRYYVADVKRGQWGAGEREAIKLQTAQMDGIECVIWNEQEPGSGGKEQKESTIRNLAGFAVHGEKVTGSKDVRLEPFIVQAHAGNVFLVRGEWNGEYLDELTAVPNGKYRDQSDASGGALNKLAGALNSKDALAVVRAGREGEDEGDDELD